MRDLALRCGPAAAVRGVAAAAARRRQPAASTGVLPPLLLPLLLSVLPPHLFRRLHPGGTDVRRRREWLRRLRQVTRRGFSPRSLWPRLSSQCPLTRIALYPSGGRVLLCRSKRGSYG